MSRSFSKKRRPAFVAVFIAIVIVFTVMVVALNSNPVTASAAFSTYTAMYGSKDEVNQAAATLNVDITKEGMVLLKNEDNAVPIFTGPGTQKAKVSLFGARSYAPEGGGAEEGGDTSPGVTKLSADIVTTLRDSNFIINPVMQSAYTNWTKSTNNGGLGLSTNDWAQRTAFTNAKADFSDSYVTYGDAAIVTLSATSASNSLDGRRITVGDAYEYATMGATADLDVGTMHARELDSAQYAILDEACANFDKVIVLINDAIPMELGFLDSNFDNGRFANIKAAMIIGHPGTNGFLGLGPILNGQVNPSGRLVDTYANRFENGPTWNNFGSTDDYLHTTDPTEGTPANRTGAYSVDYEEGIYIGYRYYETRGFTDGDTWYKNNVVYPFGYGLSYTEFDWEIKSSSLADGSAITEKSNIKVDIKVTNTGETAGKDVVELFYTAPYHATTAPIEKSHVTLLDFAKTKILQPGESQILSFRVSAREMASYDWNDINNNKVVDGYSGCGYELEAGNYVLKFMKNAHEVDTSITYTVANTIAGIDSASGTEVENRFDDVNDKIKTTATKKVLSRNDWVNTWPSAPVDSDRRISDAEFDLRDVLSENALSATSYLKDDFDIGQPWEKDADVDGLPAFADPATRPATAAITLDQLIGADYNDPRWETLLDQVSLAEAINLFNQGGFGTAAIAYIGKPNTLDTDGPQGWTGSGVGGSSFIRFATEAIIASTWNKELAYAQGRMIGEMGLWGNSDAATGVKNYTGWYAPGMNTHREPICSGSRYAEYYSEDATLTGYIAANVSLGLNSKGGYMYMKHFALHENGNTNVRGTMMNNTYAGRTSGLSIWANEQAMREIYFRPFQIAVEKGECRAAMSTFSRIGHTWGGGNYALLTQLLRDEWGFQGLVIDDIELYGFTNAQQAIRAGGDLHLTGYNNNIITRLPLPTVSSAAAAQYDATQLWALRRAIKNVLFVVANSNAMQPPTGAAIRYVSKTLATGEVGDDYSATLAATGTSGASAQGFYWNTLYTGYSARSYAVTSGMLPAGLSLNSATGVISGEPTAVGSYTFTVTCSASGYASSSATFTIVISGDLLGITIGGNGNWFIDGVDTNVKAQGPAGSNGDDGKEVEFQKTATHIQWRYIGGSTWTNLVALADITGSDGDDGNDGKEVEFQKTATHVQWRYVGGSTWTNLVALADITGADGDDGDAPYIGENGNWWIGAIDTEIAAKGQKGDTGADGEKGDKGDKGDTGETGSGCGSTIGGGIAVTLILLIAGVAVLLLVRKGKKEQK